MPSRKWESADLCLMITKTIKATTNEKTNGYLRNMGQGYSVGESSVDVLDSPACKEKEALISDIHKKSHCLRYGKTRKWRKQYSRKHNP